MTPLNGCIFSWWKSVNQWRSSRPTEDTWVRNIFQSGKQWHSDLKWRWNQIEAQIKERLPPFFLPPEVNGCNNNATNPVFSEYLWLTHQISSNLLFAASSNLCVIKLKPCKIDLLLRWSTTKLFSASQLCSIPIYKVLKICKYIS